MTINIDHNFVRQFSDNLEQVAQQQASYLRKSIMEMRVNGKDFSVDRLKNPNDVLETVASRHASTNIRDMEHSRRVGHMVSYVDATMIDDEDKVRMLVDPTSDYVAQLAGAMNRTIDDKIMAVMLGNTYAGETGSTTVALPSSQHIAAGGTGLTLAKIKQALKVLMQGYVDVDREELFLACNAAGYEDLISDSGLVSIDFTQYKPNVDGNLPIVAGFKIIKCERLTNYNGDYTTTAPSSSSRPAIAFAKSAVRLGVGMDMLVDVGRSKQHNLNHLINLKTSFGVLRAHDEKVVDIRFAE